MTEGQARYQALATSGGVLTAFIGVGHETFGARLFPWGPALFGSRIGWHAAGIGCFALGVAFSAGALRLISFPLMALAAIFLAIVAAAITAYTAAVHADFHIFALALAASGLVIAWCHPRSALA